MYFFGFQAFLVLVLFLDESAALSFLSVTLGSSLLYRLGLSLVGLDSLAVRLRHAGDNCFVAAGCVTNLATGLARASEVRVDEEARKEDEVRAVHGKGQFGGAFADLTLLARHIECIAVIGYETADNHLQDL